MAEMRNKTGLALSGSVVAAVAASLCCILPIIFALAGAGIVGASAFFAQLRPFLVVLTLLLLGFGFYFAYRNPKQVCESGSACAVPAVKRSGRIGLWMATAVVLVVAAFPYYSEAVANFLLPSKQAAAAAVPHLERARFAVEGMDCTACATAIEKKLKTLEGVQNATLSYRQKQATVEFDSDKLSVAQLERAIEDAGYRAAQSQKENTPK
jgi:mercuric ion transport protein